MYSLFVNLFKQLFNRYKYIRNYCQCLTNLIVFKKIDRNSYSDATIYTKKRREEKRRGESQHETGEFIEYISNTTLNVSTISRLVKNRTHQTLISPTKDGAWLTTLCQNHQWVPKNTSQCNIVKYLLWCIISWKDSGSWGNSHKCIKSRSLKTLLVVYDLQTLGDTSWETVALLWWI